MKKNALPDFEYSAEWLAGRLRLLAAFRKRLKAAAPHLAPEGNVWLDMLAERLAIELRAQKDAPREGRPAGVEQSFRIALFDALLAARTGMKPGPRAESIVEATPYTPDQIREARRHHGALAKKMVSGPGWDNIRAHSSYLEAVPAPHRERLRKLLMSPRKN